MGTVSQRPVNQQAWGLSQRPVADTMPGQEDYWLMGTEHRQGRGGTGVLGY